MASIGPRAPFSGSVLSASLQTRLPLCLLLVMFVHFPGGLFSRTSVSRLRVLTSADVHSGGQRSCFTPASLLVFLGRGGGKGLPIESSSRLKCGLNKWPCDVPSPSACRFSLSFPCSCSQKPREEASGPPPSAVFISLQNNHSPACFS